MNALSTLQSLGLDLSVVPPLITACDDPVDGETFSSFVEHAAAISEIQRFRARVYVAHGALPASALDGRGRHFQWFDFENHHLCLRNGAGQIRGCLRLRLHNRGVKLHDLRIHELIRRLPMPLAETCNRAVVALLERSCSEGLRFGDVGGWAVDEELRQSRVSVLLPVACWVVYPILHHVLAVASATTRHQSSEILKRIGGFALRYGSEELPQFVDDFHGCEMELLGFDSRSPQPRYERTVADLKAYLLTQARERLATRFPMSLAVAHSPGETEADDSLDGLRNGCGPGLGSRPTLEHCFAAGVSLEAKSEQEVPGRHESGYLHSRPGT